MQVNKSINSFWNLITTRITLVYLFVFCMVYHHTTYAQQIIVSEGGQKIKIYDDGTYAIVPGENESPVLLATLPTLSGEKKMLTQVKIIEAEYFVLLFNLQKSVDIIQLSIKQQEKDEPSRMLEDLKNKSKELRGKIKDSQGLYDNALYYLKSAIKCQNLPENKKLKRIDKIEKYIHNKDYIFKTSKYRDDASQEWLAYDAKSFTNRISSTLNQEEKLPMLEVKEKVFARDCQITEEAQGDNHKYYLSYASLFDYTPERLKSHLKQDNLLQSLVRIKRLNQNYYLDLQVILHSKDAAKSYGHVSEGSLIRFEYVNGIRLNFKVEETALGRIEEYSGKVYYVFSFALDKEMIKQLESLPLDYVGIMWTTGYEKYDVFEVDCLMRQFQCFQNIKM